MHEIEVKVRLNDSQTIIDQLAAIDCHLSEPVTQKDRIFLKAGLDYVEARGKEIFLRIREQAEKSIFTLKKAKTNELDCLEKELVIDSADEMAEILELLGYNQIMVINKTRRKGKCAGYNLCLDEVEGLGSFLEVEVLADELADEVQARMLVWLKSFGISESDVVMQGYDTLIYNK
ncbi:MAG: class IV adenylate cyclase [Patescibacteria group bacterium]|nr:class IV adenylate cyclase [Patescibacteria group bacterium]